MVIIGSGLSIVGQAISLRSQGHRRKIVALSRRAQRPRVHAVDTPLPIIRGNVPLGAAVSLVLRWHRARCRPAQCAGRHQARRGRRHPPAVVGAVARHADSRPGPRHALHHPWWKAHRHRMPPKRRHLASSFDGARRASLAPHPAPRSERSRPSPTSANWHGPSPARASGQRRSVLERWGQATLSPHWSPVRCTAFPTKISYVAMESRPLYARLTGFSDHG